MPAPESPDFEAIARQLALNHAERQNIDGLDGLTRIVEDAQRLRLDIVAQLRQVWNARGAADIAKLESGPTELRTILPCAGLVAVAGDSRGRREQEGLMAGSERGIRRGTQLAAAVCVALFLMAAIGCTAEAPRVGLLPAVAEFLKAHPDYGSAVSTEGVDDSATGSRQHVRTTKDQYLFVLEGNELVSVSIDNGTDRREVWRRQAAK